ncbi:MAG: hypothetical protein IPO64_09535 [Bacteroidetes bacterium]|nr:hypothetical protein [Bacteroidota bacterium]
MESSKNKTIKKIIVPLNGPGGLTESANPMMGQLWSWTAVNPSFGIINIE